MRDLTPKNELFVAPIQSNLHWENREKNLSMFTEIIQSLPRQPDLIILPEMFNTGFTMNVKKCHEQMGGPTMEWMSQMANATGSVITGSLIIKERSKYFNRLIWMLPSGKFEQYDKHHLFRMMDEDKKFTSGNRKSVLTLAGWKVYPLICYDLRFPVWCRNELMARAGKGSGKKKRMARTLSYAYDVLVFIANWPEIRRNAWKILLEARAVENQCYSIGVNRVGTDGDGIRFSGNSEVFDPRGQPLGTIKPYEEKAEVIRLSWPELCDYREKFPFLMDGDPFVLKPKNS